MRFSLLAFYQGSVEADARHICIRRAETAPFREQNLRMTYVPADTPYPRSPTEITRAGFPIMIGSQFTVKMSGTAGAIRQRSNWKTMVGV